MPLPAEPLYPTTLPFIISGGGGALGAVKEVEVWKAEPSQLNLEYQEGDDITIPLHFSDNEDPSLDMSGWSWLAQVRWGKTHAYTLVYEYTCTTLFKPPVPPDTIGVTQVTLALARADNKRHGHFYWDLQSLSTDDRVRTWVVGEVEVAPEITYILEDRAVTPVSPPLFAHQGAISTGQVQTIGPHGAIG